MLEIIKIVLMQNISLGNIFEFPYTIHHENVTYGGHFISHGNRVIECVISLH